MSQPITRRVPEPKHAICAVIGAGVIGTGWAVALTRAGAHVRVFDSDLRRARASRDEAAAILRDLAEWGLVEDATQAVARIEPVESLSSALAGAHYVQESLPEDTRVKNACLRAAGSMAPDAIIGSSASTLLPDDIFADVPLPTRCVVVHPFNPPYLIPVVEIVPGVATAPAVVDATLDFIRAVGLTPVVIRKPVFGFAVNRLQAAVVNEAMHLVAEGVLDPDEIDRCVADGLGLRWGFMGPFATMDLNAPAGVGEYMAKFGSAYEALDRSLHRPGPWSTNATRAVEDACRWRLAASELPQARRVRDQMIARLLGLRRDGLVTRLEGREAGRSDGAEV